MPLSVLHISDLHRDPANPIGNQVLLESLERDRDRYTSAEERQIAAPNLVIVSGDIVQGVKHGTPNAHDLLKKQYDEALNFLNDLTDPVLDGNRDRIVVVPGNHDVSDEKVRQSLSPVDMGKANKKVIVAELLQRDSKLRWSWEDFAAYEITDPAMYSQRFAAFAEFYEAFYEGKRTYSISSAEQCDIFIYPDLDCCVVGFSSCHNNDLLNRQGAISPDCLAKAGSSLREVAKSSNPLRIAVWHHNTEGPPIYTDYMDPDIVQNLIDGGFSLGFHGHQHRPEFLDTRFRHGIDRRMTIVSAGTLCGGAAFRFGRAYNLVEIDPSSRTGYLHLREMQNDNLQSPIWGPRSLPPSLESYLEFTFDPPPEPFVQSDQVTVLLGEAQSHVDNGDYKAAVDVLMPLAKTQPLAKRLLLECLTQLSDSTSIAEFFDPPVSPAEAVALMDALWGLGETSRLTRLIDEDYVSKSDDGAVVEIRNKYMARLKR